MNVESNEVCKIPKNAFGNYTTLDNTVSYTVAYSFNTELTAELDTRSRLLFALLSLHWFNANVN